MAKIIVNDTLVDARTNKREYNHAYWRSLTVIQREAERERSRRRYAILTPEQRTARYRRLKSRREPGKNAAESRAWRAKNPERHKANVRAARLRTFGLMADQYQALSDAQDGVCAICRKPETAKAATGTLKSLAIDHCHTTNKIRGLLCRRCNQNIGNFDEDPSLLEAAAAYLRRGVVL